MFRLHPQLVNDSVMVGELPLSSLLLSKDANYPWCILVPRRQDMREIHQLDKADRLQLLDESCLLAEVMVTVFSPIKMNVAALGNMVPQLHLHHIARYETDCAWPKPVWGAVPASPYTPETLAATLAKLQDALVNREMHFVCERQL
jgi:diadenosine tetraphosphate (Ap4A) HIT family hydrolase